MSGASREVVEGFEALLRGDGPVPPWFTRSMLADLLNAHDRLVRDAGEVVLGRKTPSHLLDDLVPHVDLQTAALATCKGTQDPAELRVRLLAFRNGAKP